MELLTADDVLNKTFQTTKFREGYDVEEVDDFLDLVLGTLRTLYSERGSEGGEAASTGDDESNAKIAGLQSEVDDLKSQLAAAQQRAEAAEAASQGAGAAASNEPASGEQPQLGAPPAEPEAATGIIQLAQQLHDDHVRAGQEEGERLISDARTESVRIVREAEETSAQTLSKLEQDRGVLEQKIDELRSFERDYRQRLKGYLENLLGDLGSGDGPAGSNRSL